MPSVLKRFADTHPGIMVDVTPRRLAEEELRNALMRIPAEIARTTNYFRSQHGGSAPTRVLLAGGGANLPYIKEFFEEKLNLPVEFFNPLQRVTVGKKVDLERLAHEAHMMGELIGLGLRGIGKSIVNIDLVPASVVQVRAEERRKPYLIASSVALILGVGAWAGFQSMTSTKATQLATDLSQKVQSLNQVDSPVKTLIAHEDQVREVANRYVASEKQRVFWMDVLVELKTRLANDSLWLVSFEPLVNYNPLPEAAGQPQAPGAAAQSSAPAVAKPSGTAVVSPMFATLKFGESGVSMRELEAPVVEPTPPRGGAAKPAPVPAVNAVRVRGMWRRNPEESKLVYDLLKNLQSGDHSMFTFVVTDPKGKKITLEPDQIIKSLETQPKDGELAAPFEMVLPLAEPLPLR